MDQKKFQLAKEYEEQIKRLRKEIADIDKVTHMALRAPYHMNPDMIPDICRELNEFPKLKAAIKAAFEEELGEYEKKLTLL